MPQKIYIKDIETPDQVHMAIFNSISKGKLCIAIRPSVCFYLNKETAQELVERLQAFINE
jgi:hypothetical protein